MKWLFKLLGDRKREYRGSDFSVRIEQVFREVVSVIYTRQGKKLNLSGERIGKKWEGIALNLPPDINPAQISQVVNDIKTAFQAMQYDYVISRKVATDIVPEEERQAAIAELNEMGYNVEILPDRRIRQTLRPGAQRHDRETLRKQAPRMMSLIQSLHGTRPRFETLAKSKEF